MVRTAGFIFGVGLVVGAFLLFLRPDDSSQPATLTAPEAAQAPADTPKAVAAVTERLDTGRAPAGHPLRREGPPKPARTNETGDDGEAADSNTEAPRPIQAVLGGEDRADPDPPAEVVTAEAGSYVFWSPFRSAWAAAGFAGRLSAATDVPVEVVESVPGTYRVGFRYHDEAERRARVDLIEAITGLELE
jgi:hypothetical protein